MIHNFSNKKQQYDELENQLVLLKKEYQAQQMPAGRVEKLKQMIEKEKVSDRERRIKKGFARFTAVAAVLITGIIILPNTSVTVANAMEHIPVIGQLIQVVTFRNYQYESERNIADVEVPQITVDNAQKEVIQAGVSQEAANQADADQEASDRTDISRDTANQQNEIAQENLKQSIDEINEEIKNITDEIVAQFETYLEDEEGYQDVMVKSEVLTSTDRYFTLKLICYQGAGSGYQWNYYYTVDLTTGKRLKLQDVFVDGADYITPISENIKEQMQAQMDADENVCYWLHDEIEEWNFKAITDETSFYINEKDNIVIGFNEGDVAPMYMGAVEFEIPAEVLADIRK